MNIFKGTLMFLGAFTLIAGVCKSGYNGFKAIQMSGYQQCERDTRLAASKAESDAAPAKAEAEEKAKVEAYENETTKKALVVLVTQIQKADGAKAREVLGYRTVSFTNETVTIDLGTFTEVFDFVRDTKSGEIVDLQLPHSN